MKTKIATALLTACTAMTLAAPALAAPDLAAPGTGGGRVGVKAGDWIIRLRGIAVIPNERSGGITPTFPNEQLRLDNAVTPEVDISYMVADNIGIELIAATTKHHVFGTSGTTGGIGKLASTRVLPPTLTVQYHFAPQSKIRPYVGAGINYSFFFDADASDGLEAAVGRTRVSLSNSFGWAAQAGMDLDLNDRFFLNLDLKYIDMDSTVTLRTNAIGNQRVRLNIDPIVAGVGVGMRF